MTSDRHSITQLARFSALNGGKAQAKAQAEEYLRIVKATARSDYQVAKAVTAWIDTQMFPPSPAELRAMIEATSASAPSQDGDCRECGGSGRRSFWALVTTERWPDSGQIRRRRVEEIPVTGDPNYWLMQWPDLAKQVDGRDQEVTMMSTFCRCGRGLRLKDAKAAGREA